LRVTNKALPGKITFLKYCESLKIYSQKMYLIECSLQCDVKRSTKSTIDSDELKLTSVTPVRMHGLIYLLSNNII